MSILDPRAVVVPDHLGDLTLDDLLPPYEHHELRTDVKGLSRSSAFARRLEEIRRAKS